MCDGGEGRKADQQLTTMEKCVETMGSEQWTEDKDIDLAFDPLLPDQEGHVSNLECIHTSVVKHLLNEEASIKAADNFFSADEGKYLYVIEPENDDPDYPAVRVHVSNNAEKFSTEVVSTSRRKVECVRHAYKKFCDCCQVLKQALKEEANSAVDVDVEMRDSIVSNDDHGNTTVSWKPRPFNSASSESHTVELPEQVSPTVRCNCQEGDCSCTDSVCGKCGAAWEKEGFFYGTAIIHCQQRKHSEVKIYYLKCSNSHCDSILKYDGLEDGLTLLTQSKKGSDIFFWGVDSLFLTNIARSIYERKDSLSTLVKQVNQG